VIAIELVTRPTEEFRALVGELEVAEMPRELDPVATIAA
jgi:hypothetical protein